MLAGVSFSQSPIEGVGESIFSQVDEDGLIDFEGGEIGC